MPELAGILLVEDNENDIILIRRSFERAHINNPVHVVRDGEEAIYYLAGTGKYSQRDKYPLPGLLLLDLKMPRADGFDVLRWVRDQPTLSSLIIIVLTMSGDIRDVDKAYSLGANSFMVKPMDFENATALSELIRSYWLTANKMPQISRPPEPNNPQPPPMD
jgi:CheY-like chemotaxis protein